MPIKLNGTTFNNGGTVTFNGQTVKEIKFGTTTVWKAETDISTQFSASDYYHPNGAYQARSISSGVITLNATENTCKNIWTPAIALGDYSTLKFTVNVSTSTNVSGNNANRKLYVMANASNTFTGDFSTRTDSAGGEGNSPGTTYYKIFPSPKVSDLNTGTRTITIDISSWTGSRKIGLCALCGPANTLSMTISNIILA